MVRSFRNSTNGSLVPRWPRSAPCWNMPHVALSRLSECASSSIKARQLRRVNQAQRIHHFGWLLVDIELHALIYPTMLGFERAT